MEHTKNDMKTVMKWCWCVGDSDGQIEFEMVGF